MIDKAYLDEIDILKKVLLEYDYSDIRDSVREKKLTTKDVGITPRKLNHWDDSGLLMEKYKDHSWKRFNLIEFVWIKIMDELRKFNISHKLILKAKDSLCFEFNHDEFPDKELMKDIVIKLKPEVDSTQIEMLFREKEFIEAIRNTRINYLELLIEGIILIRMNVSLLINQEGVCFPLIHSHLHQYYENKGFNEFITNTHLSISITSILSDFIYQNEIEFPKRKIAIISEEESQILKTLRNEKVSSILVKKKDNNKVDLIEETQKQNIDKAKRVADFIMSNGYQTIEIKTQEGRIVNCVNRIKKKL